MSKLMIALIVTAGIGLAGCTTQTNRPIAAAKPMVPAAPISKEAYDMAIKNADAQAKTNKDACAPRTAAIWIRSASSPPSPPRAA